MALEDLKRYRPAVAAAEFYQEGNETAAKGALEKLVTTLDMGKDGKVLLDVIKKSDEGNKRLANIYAQSYEEILMSATIKDMFEFYNDDFKEYLDEDSYKEAEKVFEEYGKETYKNIFSKVIGAHEILKSKRPNITEKEKEAAKSTLEKYSKLTVPLQSFEKFEMEKLSGPAEKEALKKNLTEMFKPQKKEEKK